MVFYICTNFAKLSQRVSELLSRHDIPNKCSKGHNSAKNVDGVMVLVPYTSPGCALYLDQVSQKYIYGFESY